MTGRRAISNQPITDKQNQHEDTSMFAAAGGSLIKPVFGGGLGGSILIFSVLTMLPIHHVSTGFPHRI